MAIVLGNEGIQRGLVLSPGGSIPTGLSTWEPGAEVPMPPGTLMLHLDPRSELPPEYAAKAARYGWPADADLVPLLLTVRAEGPGDVGMADVHQLTVAIAAVLEHDRRGPVVHRPGERTAGELRLAGGHLTASYTVGQLDDEEPSPEDGLHLHVHQVDWDLVPRRAPVVMGSVPWDTLPHLRSEARIHRPALHGPPGRSGRRVPLVAIMPTTAGDALAARIAQQEPVGVDIVEHEDEAIVVLAGTEGARVRQSLVAKAASLRTHAQADAEARAHSATERLILTVALLCIGFLVFIGFPAVERVLSTG